MRTKMTEKLICPYCGEPQGKRVTNIKEYTDNYTLIECKNCGKDFLFKAHIFYSSKKKEE